MQSTLKNLYKGYIICGFLASITSYYLWKFYKTRILVKRRRNTIKRSKNLQILSNYLQEEKIKLENNKIDEKTEQKVQENKIKIVIEKVFIIYASQTNTGMKYAKETYLLLKTNGINVEISDAAIFNFV